MSPAESAQVHWAPGAEQWLADAERHRELTRRYNARLRRNAEGKRRKRRERKACRCIEDPCPCACHTRNGRKK